MTASRYARDSGVLQRMVGDEILLATPRSTEMSSLSGSAAQQWLMLDTPRTLPEIVSGLSTLYSVEGQVIRSDVESLLDELLHRGLVRAVADDE